MGLSNTYKHDDISQLISELYNELTMKRLELMKLKFDKTPNIEESVELLQGLQDDFESIIKTHTLYLKFQKASGNPSTSYPAEIISRLQAIKTNVGSVVAMVPQKMKDAI